MKEVQERMPDNKSSTRLYTIKQVVCEELELRSVPNEGRNPRFDSKVQEYSSYFDDYHVRFIRGEEFQDPEYEVFSGDFFERMWTELKSMGKWALAVVSHAHRHHTFSSYLPKVEEIGRRHLAREQRAS